MGERQFGCGRNLGASCFSLWLLGGVKWFREVGSEQGTCRFLFSGAVCLAVLLMRGISGFLGGFQVSVGPIVPRRGVGVLEGFLGGVGSLFLVHWLVCFG